MQGLYLHMAILDEVRIMEETKLEELANAIAFNNGDIAEGVKALGGELSDPLVDDEYTQFKAKFDDVVIAMEFKLDGDEPVDLVMWYAKTADAEFLTDFGHEPFVRDPNIDYSKMDTGVN